MDLQEVAGNRYESWNQPWNSQIMDENLGEFRFINEDEILTQMENKQ